MRNFLFFSCSFLVIVCSCSKSPYEILGVSEHDDEATIRNAYHKLALKYHPDKNKEPGAQERFLEISKAFEQITKDGGGGSDNNNQQQQYQHFDNFQDAWKHWQNSGDGNFHFQWKAGEFKLDDIRGGDLIGTIISMLVVLPMMLFVFASGFAFPMLIIFSPCLCIACTCIYCRRRRREDVTTNTNSTPTNTNTTPIIPCHQPRLLSSSIEYTIIGIVSWIISHSGDWLSVAAAIAIVYETSFLLYTPGQTPARRWQNIRICGNDDVGLGFTQVVFRSIIKVSLVSSIVQGLIDTFVFHHHTFSWVVFLCCVAISTYPGHSLWLWEYATSTRTNVVT